MRDVLSKEDLGFLIELDHLGRKGRSQQEAAAELGVSPSTVIYRVNRTRRFKITPYFRLEDARTGEPLEDLIASGKVVAADTADSAA